MTASRRLAPLPLLLIGLAVLAALVFIPWVVHAQTPNQDATGRPVVLVSAEGGGILAADTSRIADADGLPYIGEPESGIENYVFSYQWFRVDGVTEAETEVGTDSQRYQLVDADFGNLIKVQVSFTDRGSNPEAVTSVPFGPVVRPAALPSPSTLVGNTGQSPSATATISDLYAMRFKLGKHGQGYEISSVSIDLAAAPSSLSVSLWTGGPPGSTYSGSRTAKLFDFESPPSFQVGLNEFTAPAGAFAYQNVNYWIVLSDFGGSLAITETTSDAEDAGGETGATLSDTARSGTSSVLRLAVKGSQRTSGILAANFAQPSEGDQEIMSVGDVIGWTIDFGAADRYLVRGVSFAMDDTTSLHSGFINPFYLRSDSLSGARHFNLVITRDVNGLPVWTAPQGATVGGSKTYFFDWADINVLKAGGIDRIGGVLTRGFAVSRDADGQSDSPTAAGVRLGVGRVAGSDYAGPTPLMAVHGEALDAMVQNLGAADNGYRTVGSSRVKALTQGFTTGSDADGYELLGIGVNIEGSGSNFPDDSASVSVAVHADASGQPGAKLFDLVSPTEFGAGHSFFEAPRGTTLEASTSYVLVWRHLGGTVHRLRKTSSNGEDSGALTGFSMADAFYQGADLENLAVDTGSDVLEMAVYGRAASVANATGRPTVYPSAEGAGILFADPSGIGDPEGVLVYSSQDVAFVRRYDWSYQWIRIDGETAVETDVGIGSSGYQPVDADIGNLIKVRVSFTDQGGSPEAVTSLPFGPIAEAGPSRTPSTLVGNTGQSHSATAMITQQYAMGFRLGNHGQGYEISSVSIDLAAVPSNLTVSLWVGIPKGIVYNGVAAYKLFDFTNPPSFEVGLNEFTAPAGAFAYQNVEYFIVLSDFGSSLSINETTSDAEDAGGETGAILFDSARVRALSLTGRWPGTFTLRGSVLRLAVEGSRRDRGILASNYAQPEDEALQQEIISLGDKGGMPITLGAADRYLIRGFSWVSDDSTSAIGGLHIPLDLRSGWTTDGDGSITNAGAKWFSLFPTRYEAGINVWTAPQGATVAGSGSYFLYHRPDKRPPGVVLTRVFGTLSDDDDTPTAPGVSLSDAVGDFAVRPLMAFLGEPLVAMVQNLGQTNNGYVSVGGANKVLSQGFTTGSDPFGYRLQGIGVNIEGSSSSVPDDSASVSVAVHADASGQPGAKLFDLVSPTEYRAGHSFFEAPPGAYLDPSSSYVLVWRHNSGAWHRLQRTSSNSKDSGARSGANVEDAFYQGADLGSLSEDSGGNALEFAVYTEVLETRRFREDEFVGSTQALVSNVGQTTLSGEAEVTVLQAQAQSFTTGSEPPYFLESVEVDVNSFSGTTSDISAAIYTEASGEPDSDRYELSNPTTLGTGMQAFTAPEGATLTANTTYYVVFFSSSTTTLGLKFTLSDDEDAGGAEGWTIGDQRQFGVNWNGTTSAALIRVNGSSTVLPTEVPLGWPLVPDELADEGGEFRLLFLSSTTSAATSNDIGTYNTHVQTAAAAGHPAIQDYSAGFRAVVSTAAVAARGNSATTGSSAPVYWLGGAKLADHYRDFYDGTWDDEANPTDESGAVTSPTKVWTGSESDGTKGVDTNHGSTVLGGAPRAQAAYGELNSDADGPLSGKTGWREITRNFYGISEVFTVGPNPAVITNLAITSDPRSGGIYRTGETIEVTATFGAAVTVSGRPRIKLRLGETEGSHRWAEADGLAPADPEQVVFSYTVAAADESDTDGIAVGVVGSANEVDLNGGSITLAGTGLGAVLSFPPFPSESGHLVNWVRPTLLGAATSRDGRRLFLTFSEDLNPDSGPSTSRFTVTVDGEAVTPRGATISGRVVLLRLYIAVRSAARTLTVSYADPSAADDTAAVEDLQHNDAVSFRDRTVTNRFGLANELFPGSPLIPAGLDVGDSFRLLFLTSTTRDATSTNIEDYNAFVQTAAAAGHDALRDYSDRFLAVASTADDDARDNTATTGTGVAIYWFGGNKIADNNADFYDGTWDDETNATDESGSAYDDGGAVAFVWTGTDDDGTVVVNPSNIGGGPRGLGVRGTGAAVGAVNSRNDPTMDASKPNPLYIGAETATNNLRPLYALSEVFVVVDPAQITGVEIVSDPGNDQSYATGDEIDLAVTFGRAVAVTGTPRIKLRLGASAPTDRWAEYDGAILVKNTAQIPFSGRALTAARPRLAQRFTTSAVGIADYTLRAIGVRFHTIDNPATAAGQLSVTLHADAAGNPGAALCTLSDPASFRSNALNTFGVPATCPALAPETAYFVVIERVAFSAADTIALWDTAGAGQDAGGARGWSIRNRGHAFMPIGQSWNAGVAPFLIKVSGGLADADQYQDGILVKNSGQTNLGSGDLQESDPRIAQGFDTGASSLGYRLSSIGIAMGTITDTATAGDKLRVTLNATANQIPGHALCTLSAPASFSENAVNRFDAPAACPALAPNATYFVVVERLSFSLADSIAVDSTASRLEDAGGAAGWRLTNLAHFFVGSEEVGIPAGWEGSEEGVWQIEVSGRARLLGEPPEQPAQPKLQVKNTGQTGLVSSDLTSVQTKHAQAFTTGTSAGGYELSTLGIRFSVVTDPLNADGHVLVTLHAGGSADPGALLCWLYPPSSIGAAAVSTFHSRGTCPTLAPSTTYFVVVERHTVTASDTISTSAYNSDGEDSGVAAGWSIANASRLFSTTSSLWTGLGASLAIEVRAVVLPTPTLVPGPVALQVKNTGQPLDSSGNDLVANAPKWGQAFTTGANEHGYKLNSIGVTFLAFGDRTTAGDHLAVTLNADDNGIPGRALCTLSDPLSFTDGPVVNTFAAPSTCPTLAPNTTYIVVIERGTVTTDEIVLGRTLTDAEDSGRAPGWSIAFEVLLFLTSSSAWDSSASVSHQIEVSAAEITVPGALPREAALVKNTGQPQDPTPLVLTSAGQKLAQQFTTGATSGGYHLNSIGVHFAFFAAARAGSQMTVTLNADDNGDPGDALCTLSHPTRFISGVVNTFDAPGTDPCPVLELSTAYFVVVERVLTGSNRIELSTASSTNEDPGGTADWSIGNDGHYNLGAAWSTFTGERHKIEVRSTSVLRPPPPLVSNTGQTANFLGILDASNVTRAQSFTTGAHAAGYTLGSIGIAFSVIGNTRTAGDHLTVTLNADGNGDPGAALCTLSDPTSFTQGAVNRFDAPADCPLLAPNTTYFVAIERLVHVPGDVLTLRAGSGDDEDAGGAAGWSIGNSSRLLTRLGASVSQPASLHIEVHGAPAAAAAAPSVPVVFTYTVLATDESSAAGVAVGALGSTDDVDLNGGTIRVSDDGRAAPLNYRPLPSDRGQRVNWARPTLLAAVTSRDGQQLRLTFSEELDTSGQAPTTRFTVKVDGAAVTLSGTAVTISGRVVTLELVTPITSATQVVTVSYTDPTRGDDANVVEDLAGNDADSFNERPVRNRFAFAPPAVEVPADWALVPEGLRSGARFRLLFLSSTGRDATSVAIEDYNDFVQAAAAAGHVAIREYSAGFFAVASTADTDARDNTATTGTGEPIYWLGGNQLADNYADFYDGTWDDERNVTDESGSAYANLGSPQPVWTGSNDSGVEHNESGNSSGLGTSLSPGAERGGINAPNMDATTPNPIYGYFQHATDVHFPLYALSQVFVVEPLAVPSASDLVPDGLTEGDQFRLLFLSSGVRDATASDIADYNSFVQIAAAAGHAGIQGFSGGFQAVASTAQIDARENTWTRGAGVPIYWLLGNRIAGDYAGFYDGSWDEEANATDESGGARGITADADRAWTGSDHDGTESIVGGASQALGGAATGQAVVGQLDSAVAGNGPLRAGLRVRSVSRPLYGLSPVLAVRDAAPTDLTGVTPAKQSDAPTGLHAESGNESVTLSWDQSGAIVTYYEYEQDGDGVWKTTDGKDTTYTVEGLINRQTYRFRVRAVNSAGTGDPSASQVARPEAQPPAWPTLLEAESGNGWVRLTWTAPVSGGGRPITHYEYEQDGVWETTESKDTTYTVRGLTNDQTYTFRVQAANAVGASRPSNSVMAASRSGGDGAMPTAPRNLLAEAGDTQVTLRWTAPASDGGNTINGYEYQQKEGNAEFGSWTDITGADANTTEHTVTGLTNGASYTFRVLAKNPMGAGPASNDATAVPVTVPTAPQSLTATAGNAAVQLDWTAPSSDGGSAILSYEYRYQPSSGSFNNWDTVPGSNVNTTTHSITGLDNGTAYTFEVRAATASNKGASASATATPVGVAPGKPSVTVTGRPESLYVSWTVSNDGGSPVTEYQVQWKSGSDAFSAANQQTGLTSTSTLIEDLIDLTPYDVRVRAMNTAGWGDWSETKSGTPMFRLPPSVSITADVTEPVTGPFRVTITFTDVDLNGNEYDVEGFEPDEIMVYYTARGQDTYQFYITDFRVETPGRVYSALVDKIVDGELWVAVDENSAQSTHDGQGNSRSYSTWQVDRPTPPPAPEGEAIYTDTLTVGGGDTGLKGYLIGWSRYSMKEERFGALPGKDFTYADVDYEVIELTYVSGWRQLAIRMCQPLEGVNSDFELRIDDDKLFAFGSDNSSTSNFGRTKNGNDQQCREYSWDQVTLDWQEGADVSVRITQ